MRTMLTLILGTLTVSGCVQPGMPVPVSGDTRALEGEWLGQYWSDETGRAGSIVFTLKAGTDSAWGDVVMVPNTVGPTVPTPRAEPEPMYRVPRALAISFVRCEAGEVEGRLDPYRDPDTGEEIFTTFSGRIMGDKLEGTFVSVFVATGYRVGGRWTVTRKAPK